MKVFQRREAAATEQTQPQVWACAKCGGFHLRTGGVLLTFSAAEFAEFTETVTDCYCRAQTLTRLAHQLTLAEGTPTEAISFVH